MVRAMPGSLESRVMQALWQAGRPVPGREVGSALTTVRPDRSAPQC